MCVQVSGPEPDDKDRRRLLSLPLPRLCCGMFHREARLDAWVKGKGRHATTAWLARLPSGARLADGRLAYAVYCSAGDERPRAYMTAIDMFAMRSSS